IGTFAGHDENSSYNLRAVAVNSETGRVYVADDEHSRMDIFGPTAIVPDIVTGAATSVTTTTARLHGTVNPDEIAVTECRFEYGHPEPPHGSVTWQSVPCDTNPGSGKAPVEVSANVTGLTPNTGYQYQLVASNANGTGYGQIESFTTLSPPIVERELSSSVSLSTATVNAKVNPMGYDTTYHFEYGATASYGASVPIPDTDIGTGGGTVSQPLSGLQEGVTYHYRVVASSINGTTDGQDATFTTLSTPPPAPSDTCPNAAYRAGGLSETLPDCRAYEMVSPLDKNGSDIGANGSFAVRSSLSGDRASFMANTGFADTVGSGTNGFTFYMGSRGAGSWFTHSVQPPASPAAYQVANGGTFPEASSPDLGYALERGYALPGADPGTGELNLYREDTGNRALETITIPAGGPFECNCAEGTTGYSSDMSVVAFAARANMLPQATGEAHKLYAWEHGALHLAGILPDGSIPAGGSQGPGPEGSVSSDGSRILFVSPADGSSAPQLYMRKNGTSTVWVSRSWTSSPNPEPQGVEFQAASPDGSRVLFTSVTPLLNADPGGGGVGLYVYTDSGGAESEAHLSFIARVPAEGSEMVAGMSDDATHIYFATNRGEPMPGFSDGGMYLWDKGTLHFVAKMNRLERGRDNGVDVRVSADGRRMAFVREPGFLEEPELIKPSGGGDVGESQYIYRGTGWKALYLYDEGSEKVTCVSCPPSGAVMTGEVEVVPFIPGIAIGGGIPFPSRYLSSDGRFVFFTTAQALVPQDTNGLPDVYEYDADARQVKLLSSGTGESGSWFEDASADGSNVFFLTQQRLTGWDTDTLTDLYDVRAGGGFAEPPAPRVPCDGDACHGVPSAVPSFNTASGFTGLGNQPPVKQAATAKKKKAKPSKKHARGRHKKRRGRKAVRRVGMSAGRVSRRAGR
ncbi:MAG TPA: hypothetical protein VFV03_04310, partial [Solirubrobacteraceae bacterium]|nr:hypothetical protein [Solirubrobacteraceae bacterium]